MSNNTDNHNSVTFEIRRLYEFGMGADGFESQSYPENRKLNPEDVLDEAQLLLFKAVKKALKALNPNMKKSDVKLVQIITDGLDHEPRYAARYLGEKPVNHPSNSRIALKGFGHFNTDPMNETTGPPTIMIPGVDDF